MEWQEMMGLWAACPYYGVSYLLSLMFPHKEAGSLFRSAVTFCWNRIKQAALFHVSPLFKYRQEHEFLPHKAVDVFDALCFLARSEFLPVQ
jgi:hypothetical protein